MFLRPCLYCGAKKQLKYPARYKGDVRKFCKVHCAAQYATKIVENHAWCAFHKTWHDENAATACLESRIRGEI